MKIYLDLSFINLILVNLGGLHLGKKVIVREEKFYRSVILVVFLSFRLVYVYFNPILSYTLSILLDTLIFVIFYRKEFFKHLILYYSYLSICTFFEHLMFKDETAIRNGVFVISEPIGAWVYLIDLVLYFSVDLSILIVDRLFHLKDFKMDVLLSSGTISRQVKAYYDSGNTMTIEKSPVIFVKKGAFDFTKKDEVYVPVPLNIPFKYEKICKVLVSCGAGKESYFAYAVVISEKENLYGCDCLLNVFLRR
ncbi:MAG TPA: hypothetical protein DCY93_00720 [Firmicutes bacterium]|nr:hypothetical protein [Bacillota bacterium]